MYNPSRHRRPGEGLIVIHIEDATNFEDTANYTISSDFRIETNARITLPEPLAKTTALILVGMGPIINVDG
jgi:hypothetical protein